MTNQNNSEENDLAVEKDNMIEYFMENLADEKQCQSNPQRTRVFVSVMKVHYKENPHVLSALEIFIKSGHSNGAFENLRALIE